MSVSHAQTLRLRLFIEGIEVPVISAQVVCAPNSPSVATIQIPPLAAATKFHPRTTVHLFFLDLYKNSPAITQQRGDDASARGERNPTLTERVTDKRERAANEGDIESTIASNKDIQNHNWKLMFGGEIVGFQWTKNTTRRSIILQCEDWSNYWDYAYQAGNTGIFGPGLKVIFAGASTNLFTDFLSSKGSILTQVISSGRCNTFPTLRGLPAGVIRLLESIGGTYGQWPRRDGKPPKRHGGTNIFFNYNELRLHLTQMVGTVSGDKTGERILRRQGYSGMFDRMLGGQGGQVSIRKAITALTRIMFYEMYPQACPLYKPGTFGEVSGTKRVSIKEHPVFGSFNTIARNVSDVLGDVLARLVDLEAEGADASTVKSVAAEQVQKLKSVNKELRVARSRMRNAPTAMTKAFSVAYKETSRVVYDFYSLRGLYQGSGGSGASSKYSSSRTKKIKKIATRLQRAIDVLAQVEDATFLVGGGRDRYPSQLYQQVFKPDIWFAAPVRCNVLFPENYETLHYQRMFLQEPTRFILKTNDEFFGPDALFDKHYFAPKASTVRGGRFGMKAIFQHKLLNHERFTGILPMYEKMGEFNVFASRGEAKESRPGIKKIGLAQRSTNFLYFRHRFNARKMTVRGKFNPYVAVGFPGLIIDKYVDQETIARHNELRRAVNARDGSNIPEVDYSEMLGTNFLGNFTQVVHQVSQDQPLGSTEITVTFARQSDESVEYLSAIPEDLRVRRKIEGAEARRSLDIAAVSPPKPYTLGPNGGRIVNVQDVTSSYKGSEDSVFALELPVFFGGSRRETSYSPPLVPVGVPVQAKETGSKLIIDTVAGGDPEATISFNAYRITEEIPRYRQEEALLPAEEYIRPGWYGEVWTNSKIGRVYNELVGTGAITDPQIINDFGRTSLETNSEAAQQAASDQQGTQDADDPKLHAPALASLEEGSSIKQAVEFVHLTYSYVRQAGLDVDEFIGAYTWRPIASMLDMFGTSDLKYSNNGETVLSGYEGFHSRAVGPYENLFGLVSAEIEDISGIKRNTTASATLDTRLAKREQVEKYMAQLLFSNAVLG